MSNEFFCSLKKNHSLKHFAVFFKEQSLKNESLLISLFECLPNLQSLKLTIAPTTNPPSPSFFTCLAECVSRSSLEKLHLKVSTCKVFYSAVFADTKLTVLWERHPFAYVSFSL